jgi:type I restriction enzyme, S subunit
VIWPRVRLGALCRIVSGATPRTGVQEYWNGNISWATPKDLSQLDGSFIYRTAQSITEAGYRSCSTELLPPNSVLLSSRAPIGYAAINAIPMCTNQGFKSLVPDPVRLDSLYLCHWLRAHRAYLESLGNGATFKEISKAVVDGVELRVPPLPEQQRIAAILDKADALRRKRREAIAKLDTLLRSVFLEMFGDPITNPTSWDRLPIDSFGSVTTGNTPSRARDDYYGPGIEWIKSDNINTPSHFLTTADETLSEAGRRTARTVIAGSVLVTCIAGTPQCIGNAAIADREVAFNQQINAITPRERCDTAFLYTQILVGKRLVQGASTESMKGMVSKTAFSRVLLLCPPDEMRREFSERFDAIHRLRRSAEAAARAAECLFHSLQQIAFNQGLGTECPDQLSQLCLTLPS